MKSQAVSVQEHWLKTKELADSLAEEDTSGNVEPLVGDHIADKAEGSWRKLKDVAVPNGHVKLIIERKINSKPTLLKERAHQTGYYKGIQPKGASVKRAGQHLVERGNEVIKAYLEKERELLGVFNYQHRPWFIIRDEKLWNQWPDEP